VPQAQNCARAQVWTLRERLLKLGARVVVSVRRLVLHLPRRSRFFPPSGKWRWHSEFRREARFGGPENLISHRHASCVSGRAALENLRRTHGAARQAPAPAR
jgi:hypothetical protein